ncbi:ABC transporter permease subunit [bacterium]|nr:ABC transporter permease subunit [bacterium]
MTDIRTIIWKESKEIVNWNGGRGKVGIVIFLVFCGIILPIQDANDWVDSPKVLLLWTWLPLFLVTSVIADSFAGERERHTLESLLASRLSDRDILFGKVLAAVGYGVGITWIILILGLVTVNLAHADGKLLLYPLSWSLGIIGLSLLSAGLAANVGVLVSLRAASVRQTQQTLSLAIMLLLIVPIFFIQLLPVELKLRLFEKILALDITHIVMIVILVLAFSNIGAILIVLASFQRSKLISR